MATHPSRNKTASKGILGWIRHNRLTRSLVTMATAATFMGGMPNRKSAEDAAAEKFRYDQKMELAGQIMSVKYGQSLDGSNEELTDIVEKAESSAEMEAGITGLMGKAKTDKQIYENLQNNAYKADSLFMDAWKDIHAQMEDDTLMYHDLGAALQPDEDHVVRRTSRFQHRRFQPVLKIIRSHYETDVLVDEIVRNEDGEAVGVKKIDAAGEPVYAVNDAVITEDFKGKGKRPYKKLTTRSGNLQTHYGHFDKDPSLQVGDSIFRGQQIGVIGEKDRVSQVAHLGLGFKLLDKKGRVVKPINSDAYAIEGGEILQTQKSKLGKKFGWNTREFVQNNPVMTTARFGNRYEDLRRLRNPGYVSAHNLSKADYNYRLKDTRNLEKLIKKTVEQNFAAGRKESKKQLDVAMVEFDKSMQQPGEQKKSDVAQQQDPNKAVATKQTFGDNKPMVVLNEAPHVTQTEPAVEQVIVAAEKPKRQTRLTADVLNAYRMQNEADNDAYGRMLRGETIAAAYAEAKPDMVQPQQTIKRPVYTSTATAAPRFASYSIA